MAVKKRGKPGTEHEVPFGTPPFGEPNSKGGPMPGLYSASAGPRHQAKTGLSPVKEAQTEAARTPKGSAVQEYVQQRKRARQKGYAD